MRWKVRQDDRLATDVKQMRVVRYPGGLYVQLICEVEPVVKGADKAIGIDVGVKQRAVLSDGTLLTAKNT